jgi:dolichyl-phosphate-mannose-protein mannosyltransferase
MGGIEAPRDRRDAAPLVDQRSAAAARFLRPRAGATACVLVLAALGTVLILQGWKSRIPRFDIVMGIEATQELIDRGAFPDKGILTSFGSYTPPGVTWLLLPGVVVFQDPRLFEYVGSVGLFVGTLYGIFFLARRYFGFRSALLAVALYSCSDLGLLAGSTLFLTHTTRCFYVWMIYCIGRWVDEDNPDFLAAASVLWAAGMYVFMEMAPAILVIPAIWLLNRPSVRLAPLTIAAVLAGTLWFPYLRFEAGRDFVDVRSQVLRESIRPIDFSTPWCDPALVPAMWLEDVARVQTLRESQSEEPRAARARRWASERTGIVVENALTNFKGSFLPGADVALFALTLIGLAVSLLAGTEPVDSGHEKALWRRRSTWLACLLAMLAIVLNEMVLTRFVAADGNLTASSIVAIRFVEALLLAAAILLFAYRDATAKVLVTVQRALAAPAANTKVLAISLGVPWVVLFLVADYERRFWWIWPLQVIALAGAVAYLPMRLKLLPRVAWVGSVIVMIMVAANPLLASRLHDWLRDGWSGDDADEIQVVDAAAALMQSSGIREHASIGYEVNVRRFVATDHIIDPRYKVGADFDMLFKYRHGISNENRCAEGVQPDDGYRIVQVGMGDNAGRTDRIESGRNERFEMTGQFGAYQVLRRPVERSSATAGN